MIFGSGPEIIISNPFCHTDHYHYWEMDLAVFDYLELRQLGLTEGTIRVSRRSKGVRKNG